MLMALARAPRVSTIRLLSIQNMRRLPNGIQFVLTQTNKKQRVGSAPKKFFVPSFAHNSSLCPAVCLDDHLSRTSTWRSGTDTGLFISTRLPYQAVRSSALARWVKKVLQASGVPSSFTAHSTRGASTTAAAISGVTMLRYLLQLNGAASTHLLNITTAMTCSYSPRLFCRLEIRFDSDCFVVYFCYLFSVLTVRFNCWYLLFPMWYWSKLIFVISYFVIWSHALGAVVNDTYPCILLLICVNLGADTVCAGYVSLMSGGLCGHFAVINLDNHFEHHTVTFEAGDSEL